VKNTMKKQFKILYFYQYFSTSAGSWGTRVHEFTRDWVKDDSVKVKIVTSLYYKSDLVRKGLHYREVIDGVDVDVLGISVNNKDGFIKRIWSFLSYSFFSSFYALFGRYDVAIASSGPITVGLPGLIAKHIRRKKLVFEVRDLWPQGAIELGIIKNPIVISFAYWFEKFCYQSADLIICLSPGMRDEILAKIQNRRVVSVCNAANIELFSNGIQVDLNKYDLQRKKYAIYSGNIGKVNNVEWMVEAAKHLTLMGSEMKIAFIGDGQLSELVKQRKENENIENLVLIPLMPKSELVGFVQSAAVSLVPLANTPILRTSSPNKFFESFAAGVPVVITTFGWMKDFVELEDVGVYCNPDSSLDLANLLMDFKPSQDSDFYIDIARKHFDKTALAKLFLDEMLELK